MDTRAADNLKGNLPLSLPVDIRGIISRVEETENWVSNSSVFLSGQKNLFYLLSRLRSQLSQEDFLKHFVVSLPSAPSGTGLPSCVSFPSGTRTISNFFWHAH